MTSAGLIVVKNGLIKNISPLSGHYRSSIEVRPVDHSTPVADQQHYKSFIARMEDMGADLSHVKVGKSVAVSRVAGWDHADVAGFVGASFARCQSAALIILACHITVVSLKPSRVSRTISSKSYTSRMTRMNRRRAQI